MFSHYNVYTFDFDVYLKVGLCCLVGSLLSKHLTRPHPSCCSVPPKKAVVVNMLSEICVNYY